MKRITLLVFGVFCLIACNNEVEPRINNEDPEDQQKLELFMPDAERINVYSTATINECMIDTVWVLVFNGNTKRWVEKIGRSSIQNNGQATQLLPQLSDKIQNGNTVICIANVDPNPDTTNVTPGNINSCFKLTNKSSYAGGDYLPMYGEIASWSSSGSYTCRMTRAIAKVQVQMGETPSDITGNFNAENVTYAIYNYGTEGMVKAPVSITGTASSSPRNTNKFYMLQKENPPADSTSVYIHEFASSTMSGIGGTAIGQKTFNTNRQHIILTKGTGANASYYRLDFYNATDSIFLDTKRNHHYIFTINKVRSEGYSTLTQAQNNAGSNIEYIVRIEDGSQSITSNGQYAIVTNVDTVKLTGDVSNQSVATFRYIDPTGVLNVTDNSISVETGSIVPGSATLSITAPTGINPVKSTNEELKITTTGNLTEGTILFRLGNITHRLYIRKR